MGFESHVVELSGSSKPGTRNQQRPSYQIRTTSLEVSEET